MSDYYEHDNPTPDLDELQQLEPEAECLDVDVKGPVRVHPLPARVAVMHSAAVGGTPVALAGRDIRRSRMLVWPNPPAGGTVSAYGSLEIGSGTALGTAVATIAASELPAGRYLVRAYSLNEATSSPLAWNILQVAVGGTAVERVLTAPAVASAGFGPKQPVELQAVVDGTQTIALTVAAVDADTATQTANVVISATPITAAAVYVGTREDEVQAGTAAQLPAGGLELRHCEPVWARTVDTDAAVTLSFLLEQWAD